MNVLLVDDDALIRESLAVLLSLEDDIGEIRQAANGQEAVTVCQEWQPDVVLMDIRMPVMDGVAGTKALKQAYPHLPVVILTTFKDDDYIREAVRHGAAGYLLKNQPSESIINSLRWVIKGNTVFPQDVASSLSQMLQEQPTTADAEGWNLTAREWDVVALVAEGCSNKEIAAQLFLSEGTVRNYVTGMLEKLQLRDRTQLAIAYLRGKK